MEKPGLNFTHTNGPKLGNFHNNHLHSPNNNENVLAKRPPLVNGSNLLKENAHTGERTGRAMVKDYVISQENETQARNTSSKSREPLSNLYKNFKIIHDEQTGQGNVQSYQSQDNKMVVTTEKSPERIALTNPSIGQLLSESSKQIDRVHKMLEEHRKKRNLQQETHIVSEEEKQHMSHSKEEKSSEIRGHSLGVREKQDKKENILVEDVNQTSTKLQGGFSENPSPHASSQKYTSLLKDLSLERNSAKKENKENTSTTASEIQAQLQQNFNFNMARQESFGKITKRPSNPSFSENRHNVTAPHVNYSGSKNSKNFYGQLESGSSLNLNDHKGRSSDKSDASLPIEEKLRLKNENKEKYLQQLRDDKTKNEEEQLQDAPKISQNSINILKNSKWAKENEEVRQKLMSEKKRQKVIELSPSPEGTTSTNQFKFLKDTPSGHKDRNLNEKGSYQKHRENTPKFVIKEPEDNGIENSNESAQIREIVKDFTKNSHIKIVTSNAFHPNILKDDPSIPSSSKSFQTLNFGEEVKKVKTVASTDSGFEMESGYTDFLVNTNSNELINKHSNPSQVQLGVMTKSSDKLNFLSTESRSPITPYNKLTIEGVNKVSPRIEININDLKALTPTPVSNVPNSKGSQNRYSSEDQKIEIIESNLKRLQNEYIFPKNKSPMNKQTTPEPQARPNSHISSQKESSRNLLSHRKTSKQSDELERLSSPANRPSSLETGRSTETTAKSFQMRQNRLNAPVENKANRTREGPTLGNFHSPSKFQHNVYLNYSSHSKSPIDANVYNRNNVWLSAKKNKLESMNSHREKEEMKECTFRPALLAKSFKGNQNTTGDTSQNMKPTLGLVTMESARSNKNFRESLRLAESPSTSSKFYQTDSSSKDRQNTYKQIYETRKSHTPNHNDLQQQQQQNLTKRPFFGHVIKRP